MQPGYEEVQVSGKGHSDGHSGHLETRRVLGTGEAHARGVYVTSSGNHIFQVNWRDGARDRKASWAGKW